MSLTQKEMAYQKAHWNETRGPVVIGMTAMLIALDTVFVALRIWARRIRKLGLWWDDWLIIMALILAWGGAIECWMMVHYGMGHHILAVLELFDFVAMVKTTVAWILTYPFINFTVRISLLLFYLRLFGLYLSVFKWMWIANVVFTVLVLIGMFLGPILICIPLSGYWEGTCTNNWTATIICNVANVISDFGILILPIPTVWSLQMTWQRKVALSGVFALGSVVVIISAVRLPLLKEGVTESDSTWTQPTAIIISFVEPSVGIICACLPTLRPLLRRIGDGFRSTFGSSNGISLQETADFSTSVDKIKSSKAHGEDTLLGSGMESSLANDGWMRMNTPSHHADSDEELNRRYGLGDVGIEDGFNVLHDTTSHVTPPTNVLLSNSLPHGP